MRMGSYSGQGESQSFIWTIILALSCCLLLHLFLRTYLIGSMWAMQFTLRGLFPPVGSSGSAICKGEPLAPTDELFKCLQPSPRPGSVAKFKTTQNLFSKGSDHNRKVSKGFQVRGSCKHKSQRTGNQKAPPLPSPRKWGRWRCLWLCLVLTEHLVYWAPPEHGSQVTPWA